MYFVIDKFFFTYRKIEGYSEMNEFLNKCENGNITIGEEAEIAKEFYVVELFTEPYPESCFGIGVISEGNGLKPNILPLHVKKHILIGNNSEITIIDLSNLRKINKIDLGDLFHSFIYLSDYNIILAMSETGITAIDESYNIKWQYYQDVVVDYSIDAEEIYIEFMDSSPVRISIRNGEVSGSS